MFYRAGANKDICAGKRRRTQQGSFVFKVNLLQHGVFER
jgi:hypothetical protein